VPNSFEYLESADLDSILGESSSPEDKLQSVNLDSALGEKREVPEDGLSITVRPGQINTPPRTIIGEAMKTDPAQALRTQKISKQLGVPEELVEGNEDNLELSIKVNSMGLNTLHSRSPKTSQFVLDPARS